MHPTWQRLRYYLCVPPAGYLLRQLLAAAGFIGAPRAAPVPPSGLPPPGDPAADLAAALPGAAVALDERAVQAWIGDLVDHRLDVLGSGWASHSGAEVAPGLEGYGYGAVGESMAAACESGPGQGATSLSRDGAAGQRSIDWQRDAVSGFRWSAGERSSRQLRRHRHAPGADPIRPMQLGRLLHFPRMLVIASLMPRYRVAMLAHYAEQRGDFAAANPVGFGLQWACTLDVGIRTANLVLAAWLAEGLRRDAGDGDPAADGEAAMVREHGRFIAANLEWNGGNTGNHYLGGLVGLLFAATHLRGEPEAAQWEHTVWHALPRELRRQFHPDGGHFEASLAYHGFCTELLTWAWALVVRCNAPPALVDELAATLCPAMALLRAATTPGGELPQFGDGDSARLFRLVPRGEVMSRREAAGRYLHLRDRSDADDTPFLDESPLAWTDLHDLFRPGSIEGTVLAAVAGVDRHAAMARRLQAPAGVISGPSPAGPPRRRIHLPHRREHFFDAPGELRDDPAWYHFPATGLHVARSAQLYLAVSALARPGQKLNRSHSHNDKLAVELYFGSRAVLRDPGTYVYTALPGRRDAFRSTRAHNVPAVDGEEQDRFVDVFLSYPDARVDCLAQGDRHLALRLAYRGVIQERRITIERHGVRIEDRCNRPFEQLWNPSPHYSPGYGRLVVNTL